MTETTPELKKSDLSFQQIKWANFTPEQRNQILYNLGFRNKEKREKYCVDWDKLTKPVQTILTNSL